MDPFSSKWDLTSPYLLTDLQAICSDEVDAEDPPPNAAIGSLMYNGSCSEHTSAQHAVEICYHSDDKHTFQGLEVNFKDWDSFRFYIKQHWVYKVQSVYYEPRKNYLLLIFKGSS